ncbi:hypothetical protein BFG57_15425 [Bacillus solimangrovi]|uniref:Uncharacterized protein n=1 Tax=Bacillus solimangrovi TaxID=1305675 RepID=A0A1E5LEM8_9BACI|nr:hypothetical protein BFG57_15425 [Bacillus solimangrovi]
MKNISKWIHYITILFAVLLIIPSGFNPVYSHLFSIILGVHVINSGHITYKLNKNSMLFSTSGGLIIIGIGLFKLIW